MTEERRESLARAEEHLGLARLNLGHGAWDLAAALAYTAAFHAALALVVRATGKAPRTHEGLKRELHRVNREHRLIPPELLPHYARAETQRHGMFYASKASLQEADARETLEWAERFVAAARSAFD